MAENEAEAKVEETNADDTGLSNLKVLENIEVKLTVEVGSTELKIRDLLRLNEGSVVELERLAGDPLDILAKFWGRIKRGNKSKKRVQKIKNSKKLKQKKQKKPGVKHLFLMA